MSFNVEGINSRASGELEVVETERDNALLEAERLQKRVMHLSTQLFQARLELSKYTSGLRVVRNSPDGAA